MTWFPPGCVSGCPRPIRASGRSLGISMPNAGDRSAGTGFGASRKPVAGREAGHQRLEAERGQLNLQERGTRSSRTLAA